MLRHRLHHFHQTTSIAKGPILWSKVNQTIQGGQSVSKCLLNIEQAIDHIRCIGVLSKVDLIEDNQDSQQVWAKVIKNETWPLQNGWFAVKQPGHKDHDMSWEGAREAEMLHFRAEEPWSALAVEHRRRLGSKRLAENLSLLLSELIARR
jgi:hypothetical protein